MEKLMSYDVMPISEKMDDYVPCNTNLQTSNLNLNVLLSFTSHINLLIWGTKMRGKFPLEAPLLPKIPDIYKYTYIHTYIYVGLCSF